ncbi:hypothetical protein CAUPRSCDRAFT_7636, partial [Caulochytrium protostelioides]
MGASADATTPISLLFSVVDRPGVLEGVLARFRACDINLVSIESRPGKEGVYDFFVDLEPVAPNRIEQAVQMLRSHDAVTDVKTLTHEANTATTSVPWFPRKIRDLDTFAEKVLSYGEDLDADHPGFTDAAYRERRAHITENARRYRTGMPLPHVEYTPEEHKTWGMVWKELSQLYPTHACREYNYVLPLLVQNCHFGPDRVPQIADVSSFLRDCTGWTLRPVMGLLSSRDFLNAFAFRVFHSTQYIRHASSPLYTPEPDCCHELLGHIPLFADPDFADFSHEIGLASLGASDEEIERLATIYWFTVEFGLCKQGTEVRAYGAGLLSSFGELSYALSDKPQRVPFEPSKTAVTAYPITEYQPLYYVAESFHHMKEQVREY